MLKNSHRLQTHVTASFLISSVKGGVVVCWVERRQHQSDYHILTHTHTQPRTGHLINMISFLFEMFQSNALVIGSELADQLLLDLEHWRHFIEV